MYFQSLLNCLHKKGKQLLQSARSFSCTSTENQHGYFSLYQMLLALNCFSEVKRLVLFLHSVKTCPQVALHPTSSGCITLPCSALEWLTNFLTSTQWLSSFSPVFVGFAPLGPWAKEPCLWRRSWRHSCSPSGSSETLIRLCFFRKEASISRYIIRNSALEEAVKEVLQVCGWTTAWMIWRGSTGYTEHYNYNEDYHHSNTQANLIKQGTHFTPRLMLGLKKYQRGTQAYWLSQHYTNTCNPYLFWLNVKLVRPHIVDQLN